MLKGPIAFLRRCRLRRLDFVTIGFNFIFVLSTTGLTMAQFPTLTWQVLGLGVIAVIVGVGGSVAGLAIENETQDSKERATRQELAGALVEDLCRSTVRALSRCPDQTGVIVFLPDQAGTLQSTYTFQKDDKPDRNLRFAKYEGATGHAWATGKQFWAKLDEATADDLARYYKLSPEYIRLTADLKVVVATPIWSLESPPRMLGVVSIDCEAPDDESELLSEDSLQQALQLAEALARIMTFAKLV